MFNVGQNVYVSCLTIPELANHDTALYRTTVVQQIGRSITVNLPGGLVSEPIGTSRVHRDIGIAIVEVGDFVTETSTLDPLAKSILQFSRLLVQDDQLRLVKVRGLDELESFWATNHGAFTHVILIGHGDSTGLEFAVDGTVDPSDCADAFDIAGASEKTFISLACKTGVQPFGSEFSGRSVCESFIAPFHSVHGSTASQFCQNFLTAHLLGGQTVKVAFNKARANVAHSVSFRLWRNGKLKAGPV